MKFAKYLENESIPEWRKAYLNYKGLKKKLKPVYKFKQASEQRTTIDLDLVFHEYESDSDQESPPKKNRPNYVPPNAAHHWKNSALATNDTPPPPRDTFHRTILQALTAKFSQDDNETPLHSKAVSIRSNGVYTPFDQALLHANGPERTFFLLLDDEIEKISDFYNEKEQETKAKLEALTTQIQLIKEYMSHVSEQEPSSGKQTYQSSGFMAWIKSHSSPKSHIFMPASLGYNVSQDISYNMARSRLKMALIEFHRSLEFLKSYKTLNETGVRKILKKFDKTAGWKASELYTKRIQGYHWIKSKEVDGLIKEAEALYINEFADGDRGRGMRKLRVPERHETYNSTTLRIGLYLGLAIPLLYSACATGKSLSKDELITHHFS
ncbi:SPX domain-containing protein [Spinellus fusiger]|nr:SPX domain-containing protein [Spinellus fusiger]